MRIRKFMLHAFVWTAGVLITLISVAVAGYGLMLVVIGVAMLLRRGEIGWVEIMLGLVMVGLGISILTHAAKERRWFLALFGGDVQAGGEVVRRSQCSRWVGRILGPVLAVMGLVLIGATVFGESRTGVNPFVVVLAGGLMFMGSSFLAIMSWRGR